MSDQHEAIIEHALGLLEKTTDLLQKSGLSEYAVYVGNAFQNCLDTYINEQSNDLRTRIQKGYRPDTSGDDA